MGFQVALSLGTSNRPWFSGGSVFGDPQPDPTGVHFSQVHRLKSLLCFFT